MSAGVQGSAVAVGSPITLDTTHRWALDQMAVVSGRLLGGFLQGRWLCGLCKPRAELTAPKPPLLLLLLPCNEKSVPVKPVCSDLAGACCTSLSVREMLTDRDTAGKPLSPCFLRVPFLTVQNRDQCSPVLYKIAWSVGSRLSLGN